MSRFISKREIKRLHFSNRMIKRIVVVVVTCSTLYVTQTTDHPHPSIQQKPSTHKDSAIHWQTNNKANKYYVLTIRTQLHIQLQKIPSNLCWFMVCLLLIPQSKSTIYQRLWLLIFHLISNPFSSFQSSCFYYQNQFYLHEGSIYRKHHFH